MNAGRVLVRVRPDHDTTALADVAAALLGAPVELGHRCDRCGSTAHGRPVVLAPEGCGIELSLGRAGGSVAVAASTAGPIGVDVESVARVAAAGFDDVAFDARERALLRDDRARTRLWAAKEAVLKSTGEGLRTAPTLVSVADSARGRRDDLAVLAAPASVGIVHLEVIDDGGDLVVVLATRAAERPTVDYSSGTGTA